MSKATVKYTDFIPSASCLSHVTNRPDKAHTQSAITTITIIMYFINPSGKLNRPDKAQTQSAMLPTDQTRLKLNQPCHH